MEEGSPYGISPPQPELVLYQILQEAYHRWLRPMEVCEILQNYRRFNLAIDPPQKPQSGSLFLFDRKALRYFRNDGHNWRKKKDGKTVREAHERLKAGSVDVLHCYYAHGENNENFQRRSYWMLEGAYEHIVLVHYRDVKEGKICEIPQLRAPDVENKHENGPLLTVDDFYSRQPHLPASGFDLLQWNNYLRDGKSLGSESFSGGLEKQDIGTPTWTHVLGQVSALRQQSLLEAVVVSSVVSSYHNENIDAGSGTPSLTICYTQEPYGTPSDNGTRNDTAHAPKAFEEESTDLMGTTLVKTEVGCHEQNIPHILHGNSMCEKLGGRGEDENGSFGFCVTDKAVMVEGEETKSHHDNSHTQEDEKRHGHPFLFNDLGIHDASNALGTHVLPEFEAESLSWHEEGIVLKKLDSFGRWMSQEIGDGENSLLPVLSDSAPYWQEGTLDCGTMVEEVPARLIELDVGLCLSLSQEKCFSIIDFSPDHASSMGGAKVLVSGTFSEALKDPSDCQWGCMFGEVEVPAELLCGGVLRCKVPPHHTSERVPFYITRCDRVACSEVREFAFFGDSSIPEAMQEEALLRVRFARMLACTPGGAWVRRKLESEGTKDIIPKLSSFIPNDASKWNDELHENYMMRLSDAFCKDMLMRKLLKARLHDWLAYRVIMEDGKGGSVLDEHGLGVIHMGAALGYDWVITPLLAAGVSINFRDARGWTALHWAAYHGREKMVVALLAAGAAPGAKADPTHAYPGGQTPADLASLRKHKGIAGYLAESSLTAHLSLLKINGGGQEEVILDERSAVDTNEISYDKSEDHISLKEPLAAVRNSIQAAARIHAVFRAHSFRRKHENHTVVENEYGISNEEVEAIVVAQRGRKSICNNHPDEMTRHYAAIHIQQRYRGWKGRRDFLLFRQRVVKIQAHVRGHQVRKHLKKLVWSISIVEKVILRWRRKRKGLRGFGAECNLSKEENRNETDNIDRDIDFLKLGRKQNEQDLEKALACVQSMVKSREARDQYRRILDGYRKAKENSAADVSSSNKESSNGEGSMMSS